MTEPKKTPKRKARLSRPVAFRCPEDLLEIIDTQAGPGGRTAWIVDALVAAAEGRVVERGKGRPVKTPKVPAPPRMTDSERRKFLAETAPPEALEAAAKANAFAAIHPLPRQRAKATSEVVPRFKGMK